MSVRRVETQDATGGGAHLKKNFGLPTPLTVYKGVETYQRFLCLAASVSGTYWAGKCSANYRRCTHHDTEQLGTSDLAVLVFVN